MKKRPQFLDVPTHVAKDTKVAAAGALVDLNTATKAELAAQLGLPAGSVVIADLFVGSPADKAGLTIEDRLLQIDGRPVRNAQEALAQIALQPPGSTVKINGMRGGQAFNVTVPVIEFRSRM